MYIVFYTWFKIWWFWIWSSYQITFNYFLKFRGGEAIWHYQAYLRLVGKRRSYFSQITIAELSSVINIITLMYFSSIQSAPDKQKLYSLYQIKIDLLSNCYTTTICKHSLYAPPSVYIRTFNYIEQVFRYKIFIKNKLFWTTRTNLWYKWHYLRHRKAFGFGTKPRILSRELCTQKFHFRVYFGRDSVLSSKWKTVKLDLGNDHVWDKK